VGSEDKEDGEDRDDEDEAEDGDDADGTDGARMDLASSSGMPRITLSGGGLAEVRPWAPLLARWSAISFPRIPSCPGTQMKEKGVVVLRVRRLLRSLLANFLPLRAFQRPSAMLMVVVLSMRKTTGSFDGFARRYRVASSSAVISPTWLFE
jgi:hypothetical protein